MRWSGSRLRASNLARRAATSASRKTLLCAAHRQARRRLVPRARGRRYASARATASGRRHYAARRCARPRADLVVEPQRQRDALARLVDLQDLDAHDVAGLHHLARILHERLRHRRDVHQAVLVHADVDEGAERRDVGHRAFQHHAGLQVVEGFDALLEHRGLEGRARIAAGLFQFAQDVGHGRQAEGRRRRNVFGDSARSTVALPIRPLMSLLAASMIRRTTG